MKFLSTERIKFREFSLNKRARESSGAQLLQLSHLERAVIVFAGILRKEVRALTVAFIVIDPAKRSEVGRTGEGENVSGALRLQIYAVSEAEDLQVLGMKAGLVNILLLFSD